MVELRGKHYPLKMIKDATRNFTGNKIGEGRFGTVYKADLGDQVVAVKRLNTESKHVIEEIGTELYVQQKPLRHENLVELLGRCSIEPYHLLIYEYMGKSSLQQALSDPNTEVKLDWPTRVRICLGIAKGLKHLHEDIPSRKVVHRDIKPSNILLDEKLNAKVTDFGLAKIYEEEDPIKYMNEKGTAVYMAPEYAKRLSITEKVDVFSFGILLLEIVSGKTCAESNPNQETSYLLDTAMVAQDDRNLMDLIDKNLSSNYTWQQAEKILALAMRCINQSYQLRPKMSEVVNELDRISKLNTQLNS